MQISIVKISVFVALLGLFYLCGGFVLPPKAFDTPIYYKHNPVIPWVLIIVCFVYGAVCALWGDKVVGIIHPTSFRGVYIVYGALAMALALLITSCVRFAEKHRPNPPPEPPAARASVYGRGARLAARAFRLYSVSGGCGSANR
jgi:hypothetical protein